MGDRERSSILDSPQRIAYLLQRQTAKAKSRPFKMSLTLEIPGDFAQRMQSDPKAAEAQLHLELAIALYRQGDLPVGRAAALASLSRLDFEEVLRQRQVPMPYSLTDLEHDMAYASGRR